MKKNFLSMIRCMTGACFCICLGMIFRTWCGKPGYVMPSKTKLTSFSIWFLAVLRIQIRIQIRIRSDLDLFGRILIRIRILALKNDPISTFLVCVKAINTLGLPVA
jgi:hypothetical protein